MKKIPPARERCNANPSLTSRDRNSTFVHHQQFNVASTSSSSPHLSENSLQAQIPVLYSEVMRKLPGVQGASEQYLDLCFQLSQDPNIQKSFFQNPNFCSFLSRIDSLCGKQQEIEDDEADFEAAIREEAESGSLTSETNCVSSLPHSLPTSVTSSEKTLAQPASGGFPAIQAWQLPNLGTSPPKKEKIEVYDSQGPVSESCKTERPQIPVISDLEELYESAKFTSYCMKCGTGVAETPDIVNTSSSSSTSTSCSPNQTPLTPPTCASSPNTSEKQAKSSEPKSSKASSTERFIQNLKMLLSGTAPLVCCILFLSYLRSHACSWKNFEQLCQWSCDVFVSSLHSFMKFLPFISIEASFKS
eukprot:TRINITY_DN4056_c0_g1_i1.p1 TRINITY_DN4056_c0_g1~~TRINITY_DN4056_c0_g1_i1.p1  ORF type:complete len:360 (+),score=57.29 TRINITY_DN4056_c0_g1_i1:167-1246(+)